MRTTLNKYVYVSSSVLDIIAQWVALNSSFYALETIHVLLDLAIISWTDGSDK